MTTAKITVPSSTVDAFNRWEPGDGIVARFAVDGSATEFTGPGVYGYRWSGSAGVTFVDTSAVSTDAFLPVGKTVLAYTITLEALINGVPADSDSITVTVNAGEYFQSVGANWVPVPRIRL